MCDRSQLRYRLTEETREEMDALHQLFIDEHGREPLNVREWCDRFVEQARLYRAAHGIPFQV